MITKKKLENYGLGPEMELFFEFIITNRVNGNLTDAKSNIEEMSKGQKKDFMRWLRKRFWTDSLREEAGEKCYDQTLRLL